MVSNGYVLSGKRRFQWSHFGSHHAASLGLSVEGGRMVKVLGLWGWKCFLDKKAKYPTLSLCLTSIFGLFYGDPWCLPTQNWLKMPLMTSQFMNFTTSWHTISHTSKDPLYNALLLFIFFILWINSLPLELFLCYWNNYYYHHIHQIHEAFCNCVTLIIKSSLMQCAQNISSVVELQRWWVLQTRFLAKNQHYLREKE